MNNWRFESGLSLIIAVGVCVSIAGAGSPPATSRRADETHAAEYAGRVAFEAMATDAPAQRVIRGAEDRDKPIHMYLPIRAAGIEPGQIVADVGCGKGRHSLEFAEATGPDGIVYCRDTNERSIGVLREKAEAAGVKNLDIAVSQAGDVGLPANHIDVAILVDVYRYVLNQEETKDQFVDSLFKTMKPGGVVVVVHVKSSHLENADERHRVHRQTIEDFVKRGFIAGRRVVFLEENWPREVLEFQRPRSDNEHPSA